MKKLSKIKFHEAVVLNDDEMRMVLGGSGGHCLKSCTCSNGKTYQVACDASCSSMSAYVC